LITIGCVTGLAELPTAFSNRLNRYKITPSVAPWVRAANLGLEVTSISALWKRCLRGRNHGLLKK
jgi:hypothetical protein